MPSRSNYFWLQRWMWKQLGIKCTGSCKYCHRLNYCNRHEIVLFEKQIVWFIYSTPPTQTRRHQCGCANFSLTCKERRRNIFPVYYIIFIFQHTSKHFFLHFFIILIKYSRCNAKKCVSILLKYKYRWSCNVKLIYLFHNVPFYLLTIISDLSRKRERGRLSRKYGGELRREWI